MICVKKCLLLNLCVLDMFRIEKWFTISKLTLYIAIILILGFLLSFYSVACTVLEENLYSRDLCFSSDCVSYFFEVTEGSFVFLELAGRVVVGGGTLLVVMIGLLTYQSNKMATNVSNNIAQYNHFSDYIEKVVLRYNRVSLKSIDTLKWYRLIYSDPSVNDFTVSESYSSLIKEINTLLRESDELYAAGGGRYKYKDHQFKVIEVFGKIGISMESGPRIDFLEVEKEIIELVNGVNGLFCSKGSAVNELIDTEYQ